jgi:glycosyltransferase involved in cell wall biosynthesis
VNISVCLASFNGEKYINAQIKSILDQLGINDELVICDDGSTDNTLKIIDQFNDERIKLYKNRNHFNPIFNFESAIKFSTKEIIVLSDQDDFWVPNRIIMIKNHFNKTNGVKYNLLVMDAQGIDSEGKILYPSMLEYLNAQRGILKNIKKNSYIGCCLAFSKDVKNLIIPFPNKIPMHDVWIGLICDLYGSVYFDKRISLIYRRHGNNFTRERYNIFRSITWRIMLLFNLFLRHISILSLKK